MLQNFTAYFKRLPMDQQQALLVDLEKFLADMRRFRGISGAGNPAGKPQWPCLHCPIVKRPDDWTQ